MPTIETECPCCGKIATTLDSVIKDFGTRVMEGETIRVQSYCRACRSARCTADEPCKVREE